MVEKYVQLESPIDEVAMTYMNTVDLSLSGYRGRESVMSVQKARHNLLHRA